MLRLYGRGSSINVQKVAWILGELGLTHETAAVGGAHGGLDTPDFRAMNPHGRIPVVDDDGIVVWESNAIVRYLAARYSAGELCPAEADDRAQSDQWMDWCATSLQPAFMDFFWGWYRTPVAQWNKARNDALLARSHQAFATVGQCLGDRAFLTGGRLTMGDIPVATLLYRYFTLDIDRPHLPRLEAWYERLCERPAYHAAVMRPYDELRARLAF